MEVKITDGTDSDFIKLCHQLDDFLNDLVGGEDNRAQYIPYNQLDDIHDVVLLYDEDKAIGCASFKRYDAIHAEVKRVFLCESYRGKGLSNRIMNELELLAKKRGFQFLILESGEPLVNAMALYRKLGYQVITNYGQYKDMKESICMMKKL